MVKKSKSNSPQHSHYIAIVAIVAVVAVVILVMNSMNTTISNVNADEVESELNQLSDEELVELSESEGNEEALIGKASYIRAPRYKKASVTVRNKALRRSLSFKLSNKNKVTCPDHSCPECVCPEVYLSIDECEGQSGYECGPNEGYSPTEERLEENFQSCNDAYGSKEECESVTKGICKEDTLSSGYEVFRQDRDHDGEVGCGDFDDCPRHADLLCQ